MKSIEHYIREKLNLPDAPAEVDADDLWAGIEHQLPPADEEAKTVKPWPWKMLFFTLLFLVAGGLVSWHLLPNSETVISESTPEARQTTMVKTAQSPASADGTNTLEGRPINATGRKGASSTIPTDQTTSGRAIAAEGARATTPAAQKLSLAPASAPSKTSHSSAQVKTSSTSADLKQSFAKNNTVPERPAPQSLKSPVQPKQASKNEAGKTAFSEPNTRRFARVDALPSFPIPAQMIASVRISSHPNSSTKPFKRTLPNRFSFGLNSGINLLLTRHANTADGPGEALNAAVKPAAGSSFGLDVRYRINKHIAFSTGLEYHRTLNTFENTSERRDTTIEHPSPINSGPIPAILRHRVADNLRTRFFTVPVLIHWTQSSGNFDFGIGAGVGLNFRQFANGTTLGPTRDFVVFNAATGPSTTSAFFISYRVSPSISYRLKPESRLLLEAKADFHYLPFGVDELSGLRRNSLLSGLNVGLRYSL